MKGKTVDELRALARSRGLKGYSRLTKDGLLRLLAVKKSIASKTTAKKKKQTKAGRTATTPAMKKKIASGSAIRRRATTPPPASKAKKRKIPPLPAIGDAEAAADAKFTIAMPGTRRPQPAPARSLREPIEQLPALPVPMLLVMQQKPGAIHVSWQLPPESVSTPDSTRLRLIQGGPGGETVVHDIPLPARRGSRYLLLATVGLQSGMTVQVGRYHANGSFHADMQRTLNRLPDAGPAGHTHPRWWISAQDFARLYLHGGGQSCALSDHGSSW